MTDPLAQGADLQRAGRFAEAVKVYEAALAQTPADPRILNDLGAALVALGEDERAAATLQKAVDLAPDAGPPWLHIATLRAKTGDIEGSVEALQRATSRAPGVVSGWWRLGTQLNHLQRFEEADRALAEAYRRKPDDADIRHSYAHSRLMLGDYAAGWSLFEARRWISSERRVEATPVSTSAAPWKGEDLAGKSILVIRDQGFGDQIQFARFVPLLKARGAHVTILVAPPLVRLFQSLGVDVQPLISNLPLPPSDFWTPFLSLPHWLGVGAHVPPAPYLTVPGEALTAWRGKLRPDGVGFVWRGNPTLKNDSNRSLPSPAVLDPLREVAELVDLQEPVGDFADTAARVSALRLVVTVDTSTAHVCGALGVPCWVMLPFRGLDWRWGPEGERTPWYPSLRLYRQRQHGDWADVVARMRADLMA